MLFRGVGRPLELAELPRPVPGPGQVSLRVKTCAVCRTDLHIVDGELTEPKLPLILGHEIVGVVEQLGENVEFPHVGERVGVPWLGRSCGSCSSCTGGQENLCEAAAFTGYDIDGGYAEYTVADARYCFALPDAYGDVEAAPLLCAGLIGYRSYRIAGEAQRVGLYGFGGAAHILCQLATQQGREVHAFTRPGDEAGQAFARSLGARWASGSDEPPSRPLDAAIIFAPVGALVPTALRAVRPGGVVVCAGIHMSPIPQFDYGLLWGERILCSVANLTRQDGLEFFETIQRFPVESSVEVFALEDASRALDRLRHGSIAGAAVLRIGE